MPECTCRGTNPNCYKCGGWGWIGDPVVKNQGEPPVPTGPPAPPPSRPSRNLKSKEKAKKNKECPYCNKTLANLDRHVAVSHPDKWVEYANTPEGIKRSEYYVGKKINVYPTYCPYCKKMVYNLDLHIMLSHTKNKRRIVKPPLVTEEIEKKIVKRIPRKGTVVTEGIEKKIVKRIPGKGTRCPYCRKRCDNVDHHVGVVHQDKWVEYAKTPDVIKRLENKHLVRCEKCGSLVKDLLKHAKEAHSYSKG